VSEKGEVEGKGRRVGAVCCFIGGLVDQVGGKGTLGRVLGGVKRGDDRLKVADSVFIRLAALRAGSGNVGKEGKRGGKLEKHRF